MAGVGSKLAFCLAPKQTMKLPKSLSNPSFPFSRALLGKEMIRASFSTSTSVLLSAKMLTVIPPIRAVQHNLHPYLYRSIQSASGSPTSHRLTSASITVRHQLPVLLLPLPSRRNEAGCEFVIRPSSSTVEELLTAIQNEDPGIERIYVTVDGIRVAKRTVMQHLLAKGFDLHMNDNVYPVAPVAEDHAPVEYEAMSQSEADEVKDLVKNLYTVLNMRPHLTKQSAELRRQIEENRLELAELEQQVEAIKKNTEAKLIRFNFFNLFLMSVQFGMFARLTWWEYSWDIMEPVTYFTTTFHAMVLVFGWSVLTRKDLLYPVAADHFYLKWLYKLCGKNQFDIERYNALKTKIHENEMALKRIRTPLESNFWIAPPLSSKE